MSLVFAIYMRVVIIARYVDDNGFLLSNPAHDANIHQGSDDVDMRIRAV